jgi:hypothetical protein
MCLLMPAAVNHLGGFPLGRHAAPVIRYVLVDNVTLHPTAAGAPGAGFVQTALNWMGQYGLWACLAAVVLGGMTYGFSTYAGNTYRAAHGRTVALAGAVGAVIIGLGPSIINLLFAAA